MKTNITHKSKQEIRSLAPGTVFVDLENDTPCMVLNQFAIESFGQDLFAKDHVYVVTLDDGDLWSFTEGYTNFSSMPNAQLSLEKQ